MCSHASGPMCGTWPYISAPFVSRLKPNWRARSITSMTFWSAFAFATSSSGFKNRCGSIDKLPHFSAMTHEDDEKNPYYRHMMNGPVGRFGAYLMTKSFDEAMWTATSTLAGKLKGAKNLALTGRLESLT